MTTALYIVLMGVQGAGKGTQAPKLVERYGVVWVTTGGMFRSMGDTPLGREIKAIMDRGDLVPDDLTIQAVRDRLGKPDAAKGVVFDGFPRTRPQAEALDAMLKELGSKVTVVPFLNLKRDIAIARISSRWQCSKDSSHIYNLSTNPPKQSGICDIDGAPLTQRSDDTAEAGARRIDEYFEKTMPLLDYYRAKDVLAEINADRPIDKVTADLFAAVDMASKKA